MGGEAQTLALLGGEQEFAYFPNLAAWHLSRMGRGYIQAVSAAAPADN
jgi:hypothetical protein